MKLGWARDETKSFEQRLVAGFQCVKCRGKSAVTQTAALSRGWQIILGIPAPKHILLTCTLCGYTEMYDPLVYAHGKESAKAVEAVTPLTEKT